MSPFQFKRKIAAAVLFFTSSFAPLADDLDGMTVSFGGKSDRPSRFVDIAYLRKSGTMLQ